MDKTINDASSYQLCERCEITEGIIVGHFWFVYGSDAKMICVYRVPLLEDANWEPWGFTQVEKLLK